MPVDTQENALPVAGAFGVDDYIRIVKNKSTTPDSELLSQALLDTRYPVIQNAVFTPVWTNLTVGNGTVSVAVYYVLGRLIWAQVQFSFGTTTSITGGVQLNYPLPSSMAGVMSIGRSTYYDVSAGQVYNGIYRVLTATSGSLEALTQVGSYQAITSVAATVPFTWASGDVISLEMLYLGA